MCAEGRFREDLYYRVNVFSIAIPPLRERREDISELAEHFLRRFAQSMNKPITGLAHETRELMRGFDWPGNVRELQNAIERAVLVCKTGEIQPYDLPLQVSDSRVNQINGKSLSDVERLHVKSVLEETGWNVYQAARLLQIDRVTLYNKIKKYGFKRTA
jgi:DNA-binding NtrC family response regulator